MGMSAFITVLAVSIFGGSAEAGQWLLLADTEVRVSSPTILKVRACIVKEGGILYNAPGEPEYIYSYYRKGPAVPGECGPEVHHVLLPTEALKDVAKRRM